MFRSDELLVEIYVDDPHVVVRGSAAIRRRRVIILFLWWQLLGPRLAFHKSERGTLVKWIGATIEIKEQKAVQVGIPQKVADELTVCCDDMLKESSVDLRELRSFVGRAS